jgi:hypothetical protein
MQLEAHTLDSTVINRIRIKATEDGGPRMLYDRRQAARQLSISVRSLDYLIAGKKFDTRRIGKKVLVTHASLARFSQGNHYDSPKDMATAA